MKAPRPPATSLTLLDSLYYNRTKNLSLRYRLALAFVTLGD